METTKKKTILLFFKYSTLFVVSYLVYTIFIETDIYKLDYTKRESNETQVAKIGFSIQEAQCYVVSNPPSCKLEYLDFLIKKNMFNINEKYANIFTEKYYFNRFFSTLYFYDCTVYEALMLKSKNQDEASIHIDYNEKLGSGFAFFDKVGSYTFYYVQKPYENYGSFHLFLDKNSSQNLQNLIPVVEFLKDYSNKTKDDEYFQVLNFYNKNLNEIKDKNLKYVKF